MVNQQREQRSASSTTRSWLAVLVAALVVTGTLTLGAVALPANDAGATSGTMGIDEPATQPPQQQSSISGMMPLADANSTLTGASANDSFGSALAYGDVNGDGVADAIVGASLNDTANGNNSGAVYVFYGPVNNSNLTAENANLTLLGAQGGDRAGYAVAAGDVNNDSYADVVVGAPLEDAGGDAAGAVYVVHGGERSGNVSLANANHTFVGEAAEDRVGISVGTVNRTAGDDVLVGAPGNDSTAPNAGAAYVVSDPELETTSLANATAKLAGEGANDLAGWSVGSAGDFDGDDSRDVIVGARLNDSNATDTGAAYVVTANTSGEMLLADATLKLTGLDGRDNAGWAVAEAGDVNNDSYSDVVVGAPFNDSVSGGNDAGAAYIAYGGPDVEGTVPLSQAGTTLLGEGPGDNAGWAVSSAGSGDVTCDQFADVLVGAPNNNSTAVNAGAAYVVAGSENPEAIRNLSTAEAKLAGEAANDSAGLAVSDAGDLTGDGNEDVLVGAPGNDSAGTNAGAAYVVAGACPAEPAPPTTTTTTTKTPTTTTEAPEEPPKNVKVAVKCHGEDGKARLENQFSGAVDVTIIGPDGSERTVELAAAGSAGDTHVVRGLDDGEYTFRAQTAAGDKSVTVNDRSTLTKTVDCDLEPEPEPAGLIEDVTCDYVKVSASDVDEKKIAVQVRFADGSTTTETVHTDRKGDFSGRIQFENPDDKNVTGVKLFAGSIPMSTQLLDSRSGLSIDCAQEPEPGPEPEGSIVDVTCKNVSVDVENIAQEEVTIQVQFEDGNTTKATMDTGSDGDFSGGIAFDNPDDKNVTGVRLFAGGSVDQSKLLDSRSGINVDCAPEPEPEPEPEPAGSIVDVTCENVSVDVSNITEGNVTIQVRFADGNNTTETVETDANGNFTDAIPFENPENKNVTGVRLFAGTEADPANLLARDGSVNVVCEEPEPEPEPEGAIGPVTCENVSVDVSNITEGNVTIEVVFDEGANETATQPTTDGNFSGMIDFNNSENRDVTAVYLYAGNDTSGELLDSNTSVQTDCAPPAPSGEILEVNCENVSVNVSNVTAGNVTIKITKENGVTSEVTQDIGTDGEFSGTIDFQNPKNVNITEIRLFAGEDTSGELLDIWTGIAVCQSPTAECPEGLAAKWNWNETQEEYILDSDTENEFQDVDVTFEGNNVTATVTSNEDYPVEVWVFAGGDFESKGVVEAGGELEIGGIGQADISNVAVACPDSGPPNIPPYTSPNQGNNARIQGQVTDANDAPIEDVEVDIINTSTESVVNTSMTDSSGDFGPVELPAGTYNITASESGYASDSTIVDLDTNETENAPLTLEQLRANFEVTLQTTNSPVVEGENLTVDVFVENTGSQSGTQTIELEDFGGAVVDDRTVSLDAGEAVSLALNWSTGSGDAGTGDVTVSSENDSFTQGVTIEEPATPANFDVAIQTTNSPVTEGDNLIVDVFVENTGTQAGTQTIELEDFGGTVVDDRTVSLDGGESTSFSLNWSTESGDAGAGDVTVSSANSSDSNSATIQEPVTPPSFEVTLQTTNSPVTEGDNLTIDVFVENMGTQAGTQTIELEDFGGDVVDTEEITLAGGGSTSFTLTWQTEDGDAGSGDMTVSSENDSFTHGITIQESTQFDATIEFTSGNSCNQFEVNPTDNSVQYTVEWTRQSGDTNSTTTTGVYDDDSAGSDKFTNVSVKHNGGIVAQSSCTQGGTTLIDGLTDVWTSRGIVVQ